jgi:hypothetical protein
LEKRAEQVLPGNEEGGEKGTGEGSRGQKMTQTMYTHMNK